MIAQLAGIEPDADRQTLHDLYPVTRGILGGQYRQGGAGAGREAEYPAVVVKCDPYTSVLTCAGCPMRIFSSSVSLKLASIQTSSNGAMAIISEAGLTCWPSCTARRTTYPATGASTRVRLLASHADRRFASACNTRGCVSG